MTPGRDQPVSGAPKRPKDSKGQVLFLLFSLSLDGVRITISKHTILKVGGGKIKTGRKITAQLWMLTRYMRYAQSPVPPQPQPSILPSKAPLKTWVPETGITQCYRFPQKIQVVSLTLVFLSHTWTNRNTNLDKPPQTMNIHGWRRHKCFSITNDWYRHD